MKIIKTIAMATLVVSLSACMATQTVVSKRDLQVQTKMTDTIFLDPVSAKNKTVYVEVHNSTDQPSINVQPTLQTDLINKGYKIVSDPDKAQFRLQVNVLTAGKYEPGMKATGVDGALSGAAVGGGAVAIGDGSNRDIAGGALAGAIVGVLADNFMKDVSYALVTDVQVSERTNKIVKDTTEAKVKQGSSSTNKMVVSSNTDWVKYRTQILSKAEKMNLKFSDASPALSESLANSIAGIF